MPRLTDPKTIEKNLRQAWDGDYYSHIYSSIAYTLGRKYSDAGTPSWLTTGGDPPDFADILPRFYNIGESRRILSNSSLTMMKVCYMNPDPAFPELPKWHEIVRKAYIKKLWTDGEWANEAHRAFLDGDGLGVGFVQIGIKEGKVEIMHHPLFNVVWDRHQWAIGRCRFICFVHHLPVETAVDMFGSKVKDKAVPLPTVSDGGAGLASDSQLERVKVLEYYDMGIGKSEPTWCFRLNGFSGEILDISPNEYECLPFSFYQHIHFWGMRRPMGRIAMQFATQEMRNLVEQYIKTVLERGKPIDVIDTTSIDPDDVERMHAGEILGVVRTTGQDGAKPAYARIPAVEVPGTAFNLLNLLDRELNAESGNSEADRANVTQFQRTLGEIERVQAGADIQTMWSRRQWARFLERLITKVVKIGAKFHVAPIELDVEGVNVLFNNPEEPRSALSYWLTEESSVVIAENTLTFSSPETMAQRALLLWGQFLNDPYFDPIAMRKKILLLMGEKDPDSLLLRETPTSLGEAGSGQNNLSGMSSSVPA